MNLKQFVRVRKCQLRVVAMGASLAFSWLVMTATSVNAIPTSNLVVWLNADNVAGSNGSTVSAWSDASGNSHNANAYSGNAATHPTLQVGLYSGHNALRFTSATALRNSTIPSLNDMTVFTVYKWNSLSSENWYLSFGSYDPEFGVGNSTNATVYDGGYKQYASLAQNTSTLYRALFERTGGNQNTLTLQDGSTQTLNFSYSPTSTTYQLGGQSFGAIDGTANLDLAEVIIYSGSLSIADRQEVLNYLQFKFDPPPAPEPSSILLLSGTLGLLFVRHRRRRR